MNNIILSKIKLAFNFGTFIILIFMYFHTTKRILSISFLYVIFYAFLMSLIGTIVYNPFNLIYIKNFIMIQMQFIIYLLIFQIYKIK